MLRRVRGVRPGRRRPAGRRESGSGGCRRYGEGRRNRENRVPEKAVRARGEDPRSQAQQPDVRTRRMLRLVRRPRHGPRLPRLRLGQRRNDGEVRSRRSRRRGRKAARGRRSRREAGHRQREERRRGDQSRQGLRPRLLRLLREGQGPSRRTRDPHREAGQPQQGQSDPRALHGGRKHEGRPPGRVLPRKRRRRGRVPARAPLQRIRARRQPGEVAPRLRHRHQQPLAQHRHLRHLPPDDRRLLQDLDPRPRTPPHDVRRPHPALPRHRQGLRTAPAPPDRLRRAPRQHPARRHQRPGRTPGHDLHGRHRVRRVPVPHLHGRRRDDRLRPDARESAHGPAR